MKGLRQVRAIPAALLIVMTTSPLLRAVSFVSVDFLAHAITADGSTVFGVDPVGRNLVRWTAEDGRADVAAFPAGSSAHVWGVSADGTIAVGQLGPVSQGWRWTAEGGLEVFDEPLSSAFGISRDGSTIVGFTSGGHQGYKLTSEGYTLLNIAPRAVSGDGSVIVGFFGTAAARLSEGTMETLQLEGNTVGRAVTADGRVVAGSSADGPFLWNEEGEVHLLPTIGYAWMPMAISDCGDTVVGHSTAFFDPGRATIWHENQTQLLSEFMVNLGVDMTGHRLDYAWGISGDGRVIVGTGSTGYIAYIPEPGSGLIVGMAGFLAGRRFGRGRRVIMRSQQDHDHDCQQV
jgi:uncharacterized membrane protein